MILKINLLVIAIFLLFNCQLQADFVDQERDYYQYDKIAGFIHRPYALRVYRWPEYKNKKLIMKTNNLGFREDTDTKIRKETGTKRVLITGDSHIDGVVNNSESFPNILEEGLNSLSRTLKFEIINGGVGHYSFHNYLLFLQKYLFLKPDFYIVVVYSGNDFLEIFRDLEPEALSISRPAEYIKSLRKCWRHKIVVSQIFNQIYFFKTFPKMKEKSVKLARQLTEKLIQEVSLDKIDCLDLYGFMKNQHQKFFWKRDCHLNNQGHQFLAGIFLNYLKVK